MAGITINALTGSDSAPAKANEAEQKNDIGSAKEQIGLTAINAKTEAYETAYVGNGISSSEASNSVGRAVIKAVVEQIQSNNKIGKASIAITGYGTIDNITNDATITITTRDFTEKGTITIEDGILTWGKSEEKVENVMLQVGDVVNYAPNQTYTLDYSLAESDSGGHTGTTTLSSSITQWKILNYNQNTKMVEMVPSIVPTGDGSNKLHLVGAQGYNNAVYLLNNACNSLYGNGTTITARSINEDDFAKAGLHENTTDTDSNNKWTRYRTNYINGHNIKYGGQKDNAYKLSYKNYPGLYVNEYKSVINGTENTDLNALRESQQSSSVSKTDPNNTATNGYLKAGSKGIQPYQTYYATDDNSTTKGLLDSAKADILVPNEHTQYYVASRCVNLFSNSCYFDVRGVHVGRFVSFNLFRSDAEEWGANYAIFPVVSLNSEILEYSSATGTWNVKQD